MPKFGRAVVEEGVVAEVVEGRVAEVVADVAGVVAEVVADVGNRVVSGVVINEIAAEVVVIPTGKKKIGNLMDGWINGWKHLRVKIYPSIYLLCNAPKLHVVFLLI